MEIADVERVDPPLEGDELAMLVGFLEYHRQTLLVKCAGLNDEQLRRRAVPPSSLSRHNGHADLLRKAIDGVTGE